MRGCRVEVRWSKGVGEIDLLLGAELRLVFEEQHLVLPECLVNRINLRLR